MVQVVDRHAWLGEIRDERARREQRRVELPFVLVVGGDAGDEGARRTISRVAKQRARWCR
jgi:hypothetical protein